jgi:hypothetical protein
MHLRRPFDIVLALLFTAEAPPFAALFERQFCPSGCCVYSRHDFFNA